MGMYTATELARRTEAHYAHLVAVLLAEEGNGTHLASLIERHLAMLIERNVLTNHVVDKALHLTQFFVSDLLEVAEVKAQGVGRDIGTLLFDMVAKYLLQCIVEQVGCGMVGSAGFTLIGVDTCHELGRGILRQLSHDVHRLVILTLGVDNLNGLVLVDKHALIAYLSTHLAIERCIVEHEFVVGVLLLGDFAIAQDVAGVLGKVVADELLFAHGQFHPVAVLHLSGIASAILLLLHLSLELIDVNREAIFAANQLSQVERETIGIEQAEGCNAIENGLLVGTKFVHGTIQQIDSALKCTQEGVFLLLHHTADELLLGLQFGEGVAHFVDEYGQELIEEGFALTEECVGIAHGTTQNATDHVAGLCIRGQLSVGNGECHGTKVVGADAHGHVDLFL